VWDIDPEHTAVTFKVRHLFSKVPGRFTDFSGTLWLDRQDYTKSRVEVTIKAASIDTDQEQRDNHLRSDAFFDVANHPTLTFKSTAVRPNGDKKLAIEGDLTIRGVTKRVTLDTDILGSATYYGVERVGFEARTTIDRTEYNVSWNDAVEGGGYVLGHDVEIQINLEAKKRKEQPAAK
jgi:polyisoprenoid-binding protein YceI